MNYSKKIKLILGPLSAPVATMADTIVLGSKRLKVKDILNAGLNWMF